MSAVAAPQDAALVDGQARSTTSWVSRPC